MFMLIQIMGMYLQIELKTTDEQTYVLRGLELNSNSCIKSIRLILSSFVELKSVYSSVKHKILINWLQGYVPVFHIKNIILVRHIEKQHVF